jgi:hypothetical protein
MKKVFAFAVATVLFAYQLSFASKKSEFTFGMDMVMMSTVTIDIDQVGGTIYSHTKDLNLDPVPKLEYCYYIGNSENKVKWGVGLGLNKFFYKDLDPFNVYAIFKTMLPVSDKTKISFVWGPGYGIETTRKNEIYSLLKRKNGVYSLKLGIEIDYKNYFFNLSFMKSLISYKPIPIDIDLLNLDALKDGINPDALKDGIKPNVLYNVIMLGFGYRL